MDNDEYTHFKNKNEEHNEINQTSDQQAKTEDEIRPHQETGNAQSKNSGEDQRIKKPEKRKINWSALAYWSMIFAVVITCFFVVYYLSNNSHQCLVDPIQYYQNKTGTICSCYQSLK